MISISHKILQKSEGSYPVVSATLNTLTIILDVLNDKVFRDRVYKALSPLVYHQGGSTPDTGRSAHDKTDSPRDLRTEAAPTAVESLVFDQVVSYNAYENLFSVLGTENPQIMKPGRIWESLCSKRSLRTSAAIDNGYRDTFSPYAQNSTGTLYDRDMEID